MKSTFLKIFIALALVVSNNPLFFNHHCHLAPGKTSFEGTSFSDQERTTGRDIVFPQINGIGLPSLILALSEFGGFEILKSLSEPASVSHIRAALKKNGATRVNEGHLRVGLNYFACNHWLEETFVPEMESPRQIPFYSITDEGKQAVQVFQTLQTNGKLGLLEKFAQIIERNDITYFLFESTKTDAAKTKIFKQLIQEIKSNWGLSRENEEENLIADYLNGLVASGVMTAFLEKKIFTLKKTRVSLDNLSGNKERLQLAMELLTHLGWVAGNGTWFQLKRDGAYPFSVNGSYLVPYSYLKTFTAQEELIFGDPRPLLDPEKEGTEKHVHRQRNIEGSERAHVTYFKEFPNLLKPIFHDQPLENQPAAFLDIGCGKGWVLEYVLGYIVNHTDRGKNLDLYPITLVGADVSPASLQATKTRLAGLRKKLGLSEKQLKIAVIEGDFNHVAGIKKSLEEIGVKPNQTLPYFGMVLHNRTYKKPTKYTDIPFENVPLSTGVFVGPDGEDINERDVVGNLAEVLKEYGSSFPHGFISLELYSVSTSKIQTMRRETLNISYRHHHGHSRQLLIEVPVERAAAKLAGLEIQFQRTFPKEIEKAQNALTYFVRKKERATESPLRRATERIEAAKRIDTSI